MNEQILFDLAVEAYGIPHPYLSEADVEFAKLLIKKCAEIVASNPNIGTSLAASNILKHFDIVGN